MERWDRMKLLTGTPETLQELEQTYRSEADATIVEAFAAAFGDTKNAVVGKDGALAVAVGFETAAGIQLDNVVESVRRVAAQWDAEHRWVLEPCDCTWNFEYVYASDEDSGARLPPRSRRRYQLVLRQLLEPSAWTRKLQLAAALFLAAALLFAVDLGVGNGGRSSAVSVCGCAVAGAAALATWMVLLHGYDKPRGRGLLYRRYSATRAYVLVGLGFVCLAAVAIGNIVALSLAADRLSGPVLATRIVTLTLEMFCGCFAAGFIGIVLARHSL